MRYVFLLVTMLVLTGCGEEEPTPAAPVSLPTVEDLNRIGVNVLQIRDVPIEQLTAEISDEERAHLDRLTKTWIHYKRSENLRRGWEIIDAMGPKGTLEMEQMLDRDPAGFVRRYSGGPDPQLLGESRR